MKIIIVAPYLNSKGGVARYVWELSKFLSSKGDTVILCSLFFNKDVYGEPKNFNVYDLSNKNSLPQTITFWKNLHQTRSKLFRLIENEKPDLIMFNDFPTTLWAQKFNNIPTICYMHDIHMLYTDTYINNLPSVTRIIWRILRIFIRIQEKKLCKTFQEVICNSKFLRSYISLNYNLDSKVFYPGSDFTKFFPQGIKNKKAILSFGDIKLRRPDFLIDVAKLLHCENKDFEIWIVGNKNDKYEQELRKKISEYKIEKNVKFYGKVSDEELAKLYSEALVVVHLVKEAPFGLIVTEAMACGTPVISWAPGGPEEIIDHQKNGILIPENNEKSLKEALGMFLDNPELSKKLGSQARKKVIKYFTSEKNFLDLQNYFYDILDQNK